jgi:hypothetical protein
MAMDHKGAGKADQTIRFKKAKALPLFSLCFCPIGYSLSLFVAEPIWPDPHAFDCEIKIKFVMVWIDVASQGFRKIALITFHGLTLLYGLLFLLRHLTLLLGH